MSTTQTSRLATGATTPMTSSLGGNQATETRPRATAFSTPTGASLGGANDTRPAMLLAEPNADAPGGADTRQAKPVSASIPRAPAGVDARPTIGESVPTGHPSGGAELAGRQYGGDAQAPIAASVESADRQQRYDTHALRAVGSDAAPGPAATEGVKPKAGSLLDPALALAADMLDDIERVRIANENRLRQLTRSVEDKDGETRGFGLDESHPDVARLAAIVTTLVQVERDSTKHLEKVMRRHALHAWAKSMRGVGDKQVARLLATIGDPYWRPELSREDESVVPAGPRTVSALWAYCGLHTTPVSGHTAGATQCGIAADGANLPAGQDHGDSQAAPAGRDQLAARHVDQEGRDSQTSIMYVAARRQRGQKANWSAKAKMRAYLIAESCGKQLVKPCTAGEHVDDCKCSGYRLLYERRKAATVGRLHAVACVRCGPSGKPAQPGTPWSDGHRHADALRIVAKRILRDLWREAKRIHETTPPGQTRDVTQSRTAGRGDTRTRPAATNDEPRFRDHS